ncbi:MerR family transcriptional regulator, partial [Rhizobium ruizarguesonis]
MTLDKSPDAFRTISEVADDLDLPQHVLRFWETRFPQIKPMKRGGGRRYYRPEDVDLLKGIRHLLYDHGYTIKGVQKLLKTNGNKFVISVGHGDLASVEALASGVQEVGAGEPRVGMADEDQIVGRAKPP